MIEECVEFENSKSVLARLDLGDVDCYTKLAVPITQEVGVGVVARRKMTRMDMTNVKHLNQIIADNTEAATSART